MLAVPGSNPRMLEKARTIKADEVFLDLEDAVAPAEKLASRARVVEALNADDWGEQLRVVRVNAWSTPWTRDDIAAVVRGCRSKHRRDPAAQGAGPSEVVATDMLLTELEQALGLTRDGIALEVQVESARGLVNVEATADASERIAALVLGPADLIADLGTRTQDVG